MLDKQRKGEHCFCEISNYLFKSGLQIFSVVLMYIEYAMIVL